MNVRPMKMEQNPNKIERIINSLNVHTRRRCCQFVLKNSGSLFNARCPFEVVANCTHKGIKKGGAYWVEDVVVLREDLETYFLVNDKYFHLSYFSLSDDWLTFNYNPSLRKNGF